MMDDAEFSIGKLQRLKGLRITFAVDDYGMGCFYCLLANVADRRDGAKLLLRKIGEELPRICRMWAQTDAITARWVRVDEGASR